MDEPSLTPISDKHLREYPSYTKTGELMRGFELKVVQLETELADTKTDLSHMEIACDELRQENARLVQQLKGGSNV